MNKNTNNTTTSDESELSILTNSKINLPTSDEFIASFKKTETETASEFKDKQTEFELYKNKYFEYKPLIDAIDVSEKNTLQKILYILKVLPKSIIYLYRLIILLNKIQGIKEMNTDKKTNIIGLIKIIFGMLALILGYFKISIPEGMLDATIETVTFFVTGAGYLLFSYIQAFFTNKKDKN